MPSEQPESASPWSGVVGVGGAVEVLQPVLESLELLAVVNDTQGVVRYANAAFLQRVGWSAADLVGRSYLDVFFTPEQSRVMRDLFLPALLAGDVPTRLENEVLDRSGLPVLVSWHNSVLRSADGQVVGLLSQGEDIGYRRRSIALLLAERAILDAISQRQPLPQCAAPALKLLQTHTGAVRAVLVPRRPVADAMALGAAGDVGPALAGMAVAISAQAGLHTASTLRPVHQRVLRDESARAIWVEPVLDADGANLGAIVMLLRGDGPLLAHARAMITRIRPLLQLALESNHQHWARQHLVKAMAPSTGTSGLDAILHYACAVHGVAGAAIVDAAHRDEPIAALGAVDWGSWLQAHGRSARLFEQLGEARLMSLPEACVDGAPRAVRGVSIAGPDAPAAALLLASDPQAPFQPFLRDEASVLARWASASLAVDRARAERQDLEEKALQAQKLESLGVLAGGIAHDFNNLLTGILGNASLALREVSPSSHLAELLREIELAGTRSAELTRQMLAYSGRGRFVIEPVDLSDLVEEMSNLLRAVIRKNAVIKLQLAPDLPDVLGDATQLRQVVMNLITNASDAVGERSGYIAVRTGLTYAEAAYLRSTYIDDDLPSGDYVFLEVTDTGHGMDAATQARIFEPFFTTRFTGRGLGLAAVMGIVRSHRGALKLYSEVGHGTTFKVLLPIDDPDGPSSLDPDAVERTAIVTAQIGVLVVDDDDTTRAVARRMLVMAGYTVHLASDGDEALGVYREHHDDIQVVLLDLTMPRLDGSATFTELRRQDPGVRVVLTSGYNEREATSHLIGKGLAGFIQKPYRYKDLLAVIEQAVQ